MRSWNLYNSYNFLLYIFLFSYHVICRNAYIDIWNHKLHEQEYIQNTCTYTLELYNMVFLFRNLDISVTWSDDCKNIWFQDRSSCILRHQNFSSTSTAYFYSFLKQEVSVPLNQVPETWLNPSQKSYLLFLKYIFFETIIISILFIEWKSTRNSKNLINYLTNFKMIKSLVKLPVVWILI